TGAAEFLRIANAEQAGVGGLAIQLARKLPGLLPLTDVRQDLALDKAARRQAYLFMGFIEIGQCRHGHLRSDAQTVPSACLAHKNPARKGGEQNGQAPDGTLCRPRRAWARVTPSTNSSSPPMGTPWAIRLTDTGVSRVMSRI